MLFQGKCLLCLILFQRRISASLLILFRKNMSIPPVYNNLPQLENQIQTSCSQEPNNSLESIGLTVLTSNPVSLNLLKDNKRKFSEPLQVGEEKIKDLNKIYKQDIQGSNQEISILKICEEFKELILESTQIEIKEIEQKRAILSNLLSHQSVPNLLEILSKLTVAPIYLSSDKVDERFNDIKCPQSTALRIDNQYLHANEVGQGVSDHCFIASQAPTANEEEFFWKACFEKGITIIDLTRKSELAKAYYPSSECISKHGSMLVRHLSEKTLPSTQIQVNFYRVEKIESEKSEEITRIWYFDWPDYGVVTVEKLHGLVSMVFENQLGLQPLLVHCRAGIGRTGTLITAAILRERIEKGKIQADDLELELIKLILLLRQQRGENFVQADKQFELLVDYGRKLLNKELK